MTAHTPPTPPAMRDRKLESVCFEASTTSVLTSSAEGMEPGEEEEEEEDIVHAGRKEKGRQQCGKEWRGMGACCCDGICGPLAEARFCQACLFSRNHARQGSLLPLSLIFNAIPITAFEHRIFISSDTVFFRSNSNYNYQSEMLLL